MSVLNLTVWFALKASLFGSATGPIRPPLNQGTYLCKS